AGRGGLRHDALPAGAGGRRLPDPPRLAVREVRRDAPARERHDRHGRLLRAHADREGPPDDVAAIGRRLPRGLRAAARGRRRHRLDPPERRDLRHVRQRAPGQAVARGARPERPHRGHRLDHDLRRPRRRRDGRGGQGQVRRRAQRGGRPRPQGARALQALVRRRHARVPQARRAHRPRPGVARRRAEDQADPLDRVGDHADRARPHERQGLRPDGRLPARTGRRWRRRVDRAAHPRRGPGRTARRGGSRDLWVRADLRLGDRAGHRRARRPGAARRRRPARLVPAL
ncbi:MAG: DegV family protein, partial [uncultured Solirubrobacteraceae bacterium]